MLTNTSVSPKARRGARRALTTFAATTAAGLLALGIATAPVSADEIEPYAGGAQGTYTGNILDGVNLKFDNRGSVRASLFELTLEDKTTLPAYCIDFETSIVSQADYQEGEWEEYPGEGEFADSQPGKVLWILQNSYPTLDAAALGEAAGVEGLNDKQAMSATQAAIWHFSNGVNLSEDNNGKIRAVYSYLLENATEITQAPASLTITPNEASGVAGTPIGDFTVSTTASSVPLTLDGPESGVEIRDIEGNVITEIGDGQRFTVTVEDDVPAGEATVTGSVEATVQIGRLFQGVDPEKPTQTLITAGEGETEASASAKVTWTAPEESPSPTPSTPEESPSPTPSTPEESPTPTPSTPEESPTPTPTTPDDKPGLPVTGAALGGLIAAAVVAVGGGGAAMYLSRKRKSDHGA
ncbi:thioester domain-containing protein [Actinorugispora endophytica]|uniref:TQXA domain-containing protein n=1 Tax=Actinorugispora endophytica TaxID=1605990 RepID=A0A4R6VAG2_9ACTN|nr:thioester domain-containing protein [Actinorugispora endophytica]TDQ53627.1 TQXA domain-containing protein [Actinorugispora endophytica]